MYPRAVSQIICLFLLFAISTPASNVPHSNSTNGIAICPHVHSTLTLLLPQQSSGDLHSQPTRASYLSSRDDEIDDDLVVRRIDIVTGMVPIANSANALLAFYNSILFHALAPWANTQPQVALRMTMGCLELTMQVVFERSRTRRGIPWAFVRNFARNMLMMTTMGFTGTYDMYYSSDSGFSFNADLGVEVRLRVMWGI